MTMAWDIWEVFLSKRQKTKVSDPNNGAFVGIDAGVGPFGFFCEIDAVSANGNYFGPIDEGHWAVTSAPVTSTDAPWTHCFCPFFPITTLAVRTNRLFRVSANSRVRAKGSHADRQANSIVAIGGTLNLLSLRVGLLRFSFPA
jgi:hypothetical protein